MSGNTSQKIRWFFKNNLGVIVITLGVAIALRFFVISAYRVPNQAMMPTFESGDFVFGFRLPYGMRIPILGTKILTGHVPDRGDLVILQIRDASMEASILLKRVIAIPGDRVEVKDGRVSVNGQHMSYTPTSVVPISARAGLEDHVEPVEELEVSPSVEFGPSHGIFTFDKKRLKPDDDEDDFQQEPLVVPPQQIFVLGDDRSKSDDSRQFGTVAVSDIESQVFVIWMSLYWQNAGLPEIRWNRIFKKLNQAELKK